MGDQRHLRQLSEGVHAWNTWRRKHPEISPDLRHADLHGRRLDGIDFRRTNLDDADLDDTYLSSASLAAASLCRTTLNGARLQGANLHKACFKEARLERTNFHKALLLETAFLNVDLSNAINLPTAVHLGPSTIGIDSIEQSRGKIPDTFLLGAGVSEQLLAALHASGSAPFNYFTCFLSYASEDQCFVDMLYRDLRKEGVLCWYATKHLLAGDYFQTQITEAVQSREKLIVVLSKSSLTSKWVGIEVALARQREGHGKRKMLLPICLDSSYLHSQTDWVTNIRKHRHIRSFEHWHQPSSYHKGLVDLLTDLRKSS